MIAPEKLDNIRQRFLYLEARLNEGVPPAELASVARDYAELKPVVERIEAYRGLLGEIDAAKTLLGDPEMAPLAREELPALESRLPEIERELRLALLPRDVTDARSAILEIRPGTGGEEAALFAGDLLRMYQRFAEREGWRFELLEENVTEL
ncbi:MAG TPA: PCRF domain-containing protein, partial [Paracoccaceae bacterium]|nr:PCRF domain-containing protein [Paracoccaceae bacterium]